MWHTYAVLHVFLNMRGTLCTPFKIQEPDNNGGVHETLRCFQIFQTILRETIWKMSFLFFPFIAPPFIPFKQPTFSISQNLKNASKCSLEGRHIAGCSWVFITFRPQICKKFRKISWSLKGRVTPREQRLQWEVCAFRQESPLQGPIRFIFCTIGLSLVNQHGNDEMENSPIESNGINCRDAFPIEAQKFLLPLVI